MREMSLHKFSSMEKPGALDAIDFYGILNNIEAISFCETNFEPIGRPY